MKHVPRTIVPITDIDHQMGGKANILQRLEESTKRIKEIKEEIKEHVRTGQQFEEFIQYDLINEETGEITKLEKRNGFLPELHATDENQTPHQLMLLKELTMVRKYSGEHTNMIAGYHEENYHFMIQYSFRRWKNIMSENGNTINTVRVQDPYIATSAQPSVKDLIRFTISPDEIFDRSWYLWTSLKTKVFSMRGPFDETALWNRVEEMLRKKFLDQVRARNYFFLTLWNFQVHSIHRIRGVTDLFSLDYENVYGQLVADGEIGRMMENSFNLFFQRNFGSLIVSLFTCHHGQYSSIPTEIREYREFSNILDINFNRRIEESLQQFEPVRGFTYTDQWINVEDLQLAQELPKQH